MSRKIGYFVITLLLAINSQSASAPESLLTVSTTQPNIQEANVSPVNSSLAPPKPAPIVSNHLNLKKLDLLITTGSIEIDDPQGGILTLKLRATETRHGSQILKVTSRDGEPGVITRRGPRFYATIATRRGTYAISSAGGQTRLQSQERLNLRILPEIEDYALPPG